MKGAPGALFFLVAAVALSDAIEAAAPPGGPLFPAPIYATGRQPMWVAAGDFNGDGRVDLATANLGYEQPVGGLVGGDAAVLLGNGDGTFRASTSLPVGAAPTFIVVARLDANTTEDLVVVNRDSNDVSVLPGNGDGTFGPQTRFPVGSQPAWGGTADFNRDGRLDLAVVNAGSGDMSILLGSGTGGFSPETRVGVDRAVWAAVGDFNGDGNADLAELNLGPPICPPNQNCYPGPDVVTVLLGDGNGAFTSVVGFEGTDARWMAAGRLNDDGATDLVLAAAPGASIFVLQGGGDGTFTHSASYSLGPNTGSGPVSIGDLNGDGRDDVALSDSRGPVLVFLGNGDGTLSVVTPYPMLDPSSLVFADLNGDGAKDIAVANRLALGQIPGNVSILLGRGDGSFVTGTRLADTEVPRAVIVGDFNRDGFKDLAVTHGVTGRTRSRRRRLRATSRSCWAWATAAFFRRCITRRDQTRSSWPRETSTATECRTSL
jgi:hypothetical protein